jgi:hypothetical protein
MGNFFPSPTKHGKLHYKGPLAGLFQVLLHWLLQKPCQTPKKTASKLKPWRNHFAICTTEVKPKIVASRGFFPTCDIEATTTAILPNLYKMASATIKNHFSRVATAVLGSPAKVA